MKDYWSTNSEMRDNYIPSKMSRNRFLEISIPLHLVDNMTEKKRGELGYDKPSVFTVNKVLTKICSVK